MPKREEGVYQNGFVHSGWNMYLEWNTQGRFDARAVFLSEMKEHQLAIQKTYGYLMKHHQGEPLGIECKSLSSDRWAFVIKNVEAESTFRVVYFDESGFSGHMIYQNMAKALGEMLSEGFTQVDHGALDKTAATQKWQTGMQRSAIKQLHQHGIISWTEMLVQLESVC